MSASTTGGWRFVFGFSIRRGVVTLLFDFSQDLNLISLSLSIYVSISVTLPEIESPTFVDFEDQGESTSSLCGFNWSRIWFLRH